MVNMRLFPRKDSPGFLIRRTATLLKSGLREAFQEHGMDVTPEQWSVLGLFGKRKESIKAGWRKRLIRTDTISRGSWTSWSAVG